MKIEYKTKKYNKTRENNQQIYRKETNNKCGNALRNKTHFKWVFLNLQFCLSYRYTFSRSREISKRDNSKEIQNYETNKSVYLLFYHKQTQTNI